MNQLVKNEKIKYAGIATRIKHTTMTCKTFEVKIDKSSNTKTQNQFLKKVFREAKWLYNYILGSENIFTIPTNTKEVVVLNKDREPEVRQLSTLSAQMIQGLITRTQINIVSLSRLKELGSKVGRLKYKSQVNSIPLKQYNSTYSVKRSKVKLQGCKKPFKVSGLEQLPIGADLTAAVLVYKSGDYYIKITCYVDKVIRPVTGRSVGLDFGIKDNVTTSDGEKYNFILPESKQLKKVQRRLYKSVKGSKNRYKRRLKLQREYYKLGCKKKDTCNQFINYLTTTYDNICIQDENIAAWKGSQMRGWGKRIQHSVMGGIISVLKLRPETCIVDRFVPTTQLCPNCGTLNKHSLEQRTYKCACGYTCDRDIHAARNILSLGLNIPTEHRNIHACGEVTSTSVPEAGTSYLVETGSP